MGLIQWAPMIEAQHPANPSFTRYSFFWKPRRQNDLFSVQQAKKMALRDGRYSISKAPIKISRIGYQDGRIEAQKLRLFIPTFFLIQPSKRLLICGFALTQLSRRWNIDIQVIGEMPETGSDGMVESLERQWSQFTTNSLIEKQLPKAHSNPDCSAWLFYFPWYAW